MEIKDMIEALEKEGYKIEAPQKKEVVWGYADFYLRKQYWYISDTGKVFGEFWENRPTDYYRYQQGNVFCYEEEAKNQVNLNILTAKYLELIRQTNEDVGLVVDWEDEEQRKIAFCWDHY